MADILQILPIGLALAAGAALGILFFGGLRLTVGALCETKRPLVRFPVREFRGRCSGRRPGRPPADSEVGRYETVSPKTALAVALVSLYVRIAVTGLGFYLVAGGHWERLVSALAGFLIARSILLRRWGPVRRCGAPAGEV